MYECEAYVSTVQRRIQRRVHRRVSEALSKVPHFSVSPLIKVTWEPQDNSLHTQPVLPDLPNPLQGITMDWISKRLRWHHLQSNVQLSYQQVRKLICMCSEQDINLEACLHPPVSLCL